MKQLGWIVCRTLIEKKKKGSKSLLFSFLPPSQQKIIQNLEQPSQDVTLGFDLKNDLLNWTHDSWFIPFLRTYSDKEVCLFLSSIEESAAQKMKKSLKVSMPLLNIPSIAQTFFKEKMAQFLLLEAPELLPMEALPRSPLNVLLELSSEELRWIIELLGLHDLAPELKQIMEP